MRRWVTAGRGTAPAAGWVTAALCGLGALTAAAPAFAAGLRILAPSSGAKVRENVRVVVPRAAVPQSGFVALYVDGRFVLAQSPPRRPSQPMAFVWNTKQSLSETHGTEKGEIGDGPHTLEVRSYSNSGDLLERAQVSVRVDNTLEVRKGQPVSLAYRFRVGDSTKYTHRVQVSAAPTTGPGSVAPGTSSELRQTESADIAVFVEDVVGKQAFMRERRESPVTLSINEQRQPVAVDSSSRYFEMDAVGQVKRTMAMEREKRQPLINVLKLPGRSVRVGESWTAPLRIALGNFVPDQIVVTKSKNTLEGIVWEHGRPAARIKSTYDATARLSLPTLGIPTGDYKFKGTSTILFAPSLGKVLRAEHQLDGDLTIDLLQTQTTAAGPGGSGGFAPTLYGGYGGPPGMGGPPGAAGSPYAPPGMGAPPGAVPGGAPGYGGPPVGYAGPPGAAVTPAARVATLVPVGTRAQVGGYGGYGGYGGPDTTGYGGTPAPPTTQTYKTKINVVTSVAA